MYFSYRRWHWRIVQMQIIAAFSGCHDEVQECLSFLDVLGVFQNRPHRPPKVTNPHQGNRSGHPDSVGRARKAFQFMRGRTRLRKLLDNTVVLAQFFLLQTACRGLFSDPLCPVTGTASKIKQACIDHVVHFAAILILPIKSFGRIENQIPKVLMSPL